MASANYNERSWAIDLIAYLQSIAHASHRPVRHAGGEQTISVDGGSMFPDVLLFGDRDAARILQGWELKLPDTPIDDGDFFDNAARKAVSLGLDSFILWNVRYARLYVLDDTSQDFVLHTEWDELSDIQTRADVLRNRARWEALGAEILGAVNALLTSGGLEGRQFIEAYRSGGLTALILQNTQLLADAIRARAQASRNLRSQVTWWWSRNQQDYDGNDQYLALARVNLINWMGKFLFAHVLRERDDRAGVVTEIDESTTPVEALGTFDRITQDCNFWTIFCDALALYVVPGAAWRQLCQFNRLLGDLRVGAVDQSQLSTLLEASSAVSDRKIRGQYTTPPPLAKLLAKLSLDDLNDRILDPCCGSGTIVRAALDMKLQAAINPANAAEQICGNDLDKSAVQMATFSLTSPLLMRQPLRLFSRDAFQLQPKLQVSFRDPSDGAERAEELGTFQAIVSNLPFVAQEGRETYGNAMQAVNATLATTGEALSLRADVAAFLPFALYDLLEPGGRMGIIMTNAWLGTAWGETFYDRIKDFFELRTVITSGAGRWFSNSKVVTNVLILQRLGGGEVENGYTDFVILKQPIDALEDDEHASNVAALIDLGTPQDEVLSIHRTNRSCIEAMRPLGLAGSAQFVDVDWLLNVPLVPVRDLFTIRRGERRGWNKMFYPAPDHGIESHYIQPALRSSKEIQGLATRATKEAFSCSLTVGELEERGDEGAIAWIARFRNARNGNNELLPDVLAKANLHWYQMPTDRRDEFVIPINYGNRVYISRLDPPAFVDQRLTVMNTKLHVDPDISHALLNSTIGLLMIEAIGFGRGQGALDLNKDRMESYLHMLDPEAVDASARRRIVDAFRPLLEREILEIGDELEQEDRIILDDEILASFGIEIGRESIYNALRALNEIRNAVDV